MKLSTLFCFLFLGISCVKAQDCVEKDIYSVKLYPPYSDCDIKNLAKIITNGSEVFVLLPVRQRRCGNGYVLKSSRFLDKYWDIEEVEKELQRLPYDADSMSLKIYDFGIIWDCNLDRFKSKTNCELLNLYFDSDGEIKQLGNLSPTPYVIAELILRDIKVFLNWEGNFMVEKDAYCP